MGTTKLPSIENVFDLIERKIFVTYRTRNIDIAGKRKPRSTFAEGEEQFGREFAQAAFALDLIAVQLSVLSGKAQHGDAHCQYGVSRHAGKPFLVFAKARDCAHPSWLAIVCSASSEWRQSLQPIQ